MDDEQMCMGTAYESSGHSRKPRYGNLGSNQESLIC
jgi:hypothetical protein